MFKVYTKQDTHNYKTYWLSSLSFGSSCSRTTSCSRLTRGSTSSSFTRDTIATLLTLISRCSTLTLTMEQVHHLKRVFTVLKFYKNVCRSVLVSFSIDYTYGGSSISLLSSWSLLTMSSLSSSCTCRARGSSGALGSLVSVLSMLSLLTLRSFMTLIFIKEKINTHNALPETQLKAKIPSIKCNMLFVINLIKLTGAP